MLIYTSKNGIRKKKSKTINILDTGSCWDELFKHPLGFFTVHLNKLFERNY